MNRDGKDALELAAEMGHTSCAVKLMDLGVELRVRYRSLSLAHTTLRAPPRLSLPHAHATLTPLRTRRIGALKLRVDHRPSVSCRNFISSDLGNTGSRLPTAFPSAGLSFSRVHSTVCGPIAGMHIGGLQSH